MHGTRRSGFSTKGLVCLVASAVTLASASPGCRGKNTDAARDLVNAFATGCKSQGTWTQAALAQTEALAHVIENLKDNDSCKGVGSALRTVQSLSTEIQRLATDPSTLAEKEAEERKRQLLIELSTATDPTLQSALAYELNSTDIALAQARAKAAVTADEQGRTNLVRGLNQITGYITTLTGDQVQLAACSRDNPMLGVQIGAGVLAIAGTFVNPAIGAAMSMAGNVLSGVVQYAHDNHYDRAIQKIRAPEMQAAMTCGLESMENTWCEAQDLYTLTRLQAESYPAQWTPTPFWSGIDLWARKVPDLLSWISKVASGVKPRDPSSAGSQNEIWAKVNHLLSLQRSAEGQISYTLRLLANPPQGGGGSGWLEQTTRKGLKDLGTLMVGYMPQLRHHAYSGGGGENPIMEYFNGTTLLYRLVDRPLNCVPNGMGPDACLGADRIPLPALGFPFIAEQARAVFAEVAAHVLAELHLVIDVDPSGLLREAVQSPKLGRQAPIETVRELIGFLDESALYYERLGTPEALQMVPFILDTRRILQETLVTILSAPGTKDGDQKVVTELFEKLNLIYGTDFISGRIYRHIHWDLLSRVEHGEAPKDVTEILRASGRDAIQELAGSHGTGSLDELLQDLGSSQSISQQNVENFVGYFADGIEESLKQLRAAADRAGEPLEGPHRPNRMLQARLCVLLLSSSTQWPKKVDARLCEGTVLESIHPGIPEKLRFEELRTGLKGQPLEKRMCTYQRFLRRSRLFESRPQPLSID